MYGVSFYGSSETAGSVADRIQTVGGTETAGSVGNRNGSKNETAGGIGIGREIPDPFPEIDKTLERDTVSFMGSSDSENTGISNIVKVFGVATCAALAIAGMGYAHKADLVGKMSDGKFKDILRKTDIITEPCHKICSKIKQFVQKHDKFFD